MASVTGTVTDPLGASDADTQTVLTGGPPGIHTITRSAMANRVIWTSPSPGFESDQQPALVPDNVNVGPLSASASTTLGVKFTMLHDVRLVGMRVYQAPNVGGTIPIGLFDSNGALVASGAVTFTAGVQGWVEGRFNSPVNANNGDTFAVGYLLPPGADYAWTAWQWNAQDWIGWPFEIDVSAGVFSPGSSLSYALGAGPLKGQGYWADPIAEWDYDTPRFYQGDSAAYFAQFENGGSRHAFPIGIFSPDPPWLQGYRDIGCNTIVGGFYYDEYLAAAKAIPDFDWYPDNNDYFATDAPTLTQIDPVLSEMVRGYYVIDEPDINQPYKSPAVLRPWYNDMRKKDSTRPLWLGFSFGVFRNQGYFNLPVGASMRVVNSEARAFADLPDITTGDWYTLAANDSYVPVGDEFQGIGPSKFGIWGYAEQIGRLRQLHDSRIPCYGYVEVTSEVPNLPIPGDVVKAAWAQLISGADGLIYFGHRFANQVVTQDFAAILRDPPMKAAVTALNARILSLGPALLSKELPLIESYTSSGVMAVAKGGLAAGHKIPIHYTARRAGGTTYLFVQAIRPGATTGVFYAPSLAGATLTVIDESRTVTIDSGGHFTDTFAADYTYHLYSTSTAPTYTVPANTVAPVVSTDGTPQQGEMITVSTGTWTGVPAPTFSYQWQRNGTNISGATGQGYTLQAADVSQSIRCVVTATNTQGSASANSNAITPAAPVGSGDFSRDFNGGGTIQLGGGTLGAVLNGAHSIVAVVKPDVLTGNQEVVAFGDSANTRGGLAYSAAGALTYFTPTEARSSVGSVVTADQWQILAFTKAAGTIVPRWHRVATDVGTWSHATLDNTITDKTNTITRIQIGQFIEATGNVDGQIAVIALFATELTDAQIESIQTAKTTQVLKNLGAVGLWEFNQGDITVPVDDLIGTADQVAESGTAVLADKPTGWVYGAT